MSAPRQVGAGHQANKMADEDFQKQLLNLGFEPVRGIGGESAIEVFKDELMRWTPILKAGGVKSE